MKNKRNMRIVIAGHVDHGKSTIIGRMLADTNSLPEGKLESVKENCRRNSKPFEYAFLLDALKDEQSQGITIDSARIFFSSEKCNYTILDAPGHIEFLKNMITGSSNADAALLVIDANEGIKENSKRHGYLLSMLGIKQIGVLINKMDLVDFKQNIFESIKKEYMDFLHSIGIDVKHCVPVSGKNGDNIVFYSENMKWYKGMSVIELLDAFEESKPAIHKPFRMPVQDVYKFTANNDSRRIIAGRIESGIINVGDEIMFYPSGKKSKVKTIEYFNGPIKQKDYAGNSTGFTLEDEIYVKRGQIACKTNEKKPIIGSKIKANIFWLDRVSLNIGDELILKHCTYKNEVKLLDIIKVLDSSSLQVKNSKIINRFDVAECVFELKTEITYDTINENQALGRFVLVRDYENVGGGIIAEKIADEFDWIRESVLKRNEKWIMSNISRYERALRYNQKPHVIVITGEKNSGRKFIAKHLEKMLFNEGKYVYYIGMGSIVYGIDADLKSKNNENEEHIRRLGEIAYILMDAGVILIITALRLDKEDIELIKTIIEEQEITVIWTGEKITTDIVPDIHIEKTDAIKSIINEITEYLREKGVIFNPYGK